MTETTESLRQDLDQLKTDLIISVSVLSGCIIVLLCLIIFLFCWVSRNYHKALKDALEPFKLARPKLIHKTPKNPTNKSYDNPTFTKTENNGGDSNKNGFLNPISRRTQTSFSDDNFSFESPEYMARDSRFY